MATTVAIAAMSALAIVAQDQVPLRAEAPPSPCTNSAPMDEGLPSRWNELFSLHWRVRAGELLGVLRDFRGHRGRTVACARCSARRHRNMRGSVRSFGFEGMSLVFRARISHTAPTKRRATVEQPPNWLLARLYQCPGDQIATAPLARSPRPHRWITHR